MAGITENIEQQIVQLTGFQDDQLPFKYLRIVIKPQMLIKQACMILVEKIIAKIWNWPIKKLSYAGKIQLTNYVSMIMLLCWGQNFLLPKMVLQKVNQVCKQFLWGSSVDTRRMTLVF